MYNLVQIFQDPDPEAAWEKEPSRIRDTGVAIRWFPLEISPPISRSLISHLLIRRKLIPLYI